MRLGIDVSSYFETAAKNAKYFDGEKEINPLDAFRANGVDCMRIRLWADPYSPDGKPYLGGTCDLDNALKLCRLAAEKGYGIMFDFHYSDFWADPGKQFIPKAWSGLGLDELTDRVYAYTAEVLRTLRKHDVELEYIQTGNEITNGMLWPIGRLLDNPNGKRQNYPAFCSLLKAGVKACREIYPEAKIVLHLEKSYDQALYAEFFGEMQNNGVDYDVIGFSYYPYWHGTFGQFFANVDMCRKFAKELIVTEAAYAFTLEPFIKEAHGGAKLVLGDGDAENSDFARKYPVSPEGQSRFTRDLLELAEEHGVSMVCWWEPVWIHADGTCWASEEGEAYICETGKPTRNEWANQCLFDYCGRQLPAFKEFAVRRR